ncbi:MAG: electron transporter RnfD [Mucilaginibacter sp.]|nr:electron transporter RnfD [Mucilaginibacter sp.]
MKNRCFLIFLLNVASTFCFAQNVVIKSHDPHIRYSGRIIMQDEASELSWQGTSLKINFKGTGVRATLKDEYGFDYFNVIVDNKVVAVIQPDSFRREYTLVSGLPVGSHKLELFKRTEWAMGKTWFYKFELDKNASILPPPPPQKRKIEYFGDSISLGYAAEDLTGQDRGTAPYENGYLSYTTLTAQHFDAEFHNTSRSGIGIMVSWDALTMPELYSRLDPTDAENKWDFSKYVPDVVVINLFQNDAWLVKMPENAQFKAKFGNKPPTDDQTTKAYRDFVKTIRGKYPKAQIICVLGNMDAVKDGSPWPGYVQKAVAQMGDKNIYTHFFPYKNTPGHPSKKEQRAIADDLIAFIDQHLKW